TKRRPGSAAAGDTANIAVMVAEDAFDPELRGKQALAKARALSVHGLLSFTGHREMSWTVPTDTFGRVVRVQLESSSGVAMLGLQHVEVLGVSSEAYVGPRVVDVVCSEALTVAICPPLSIRGELHEKFQRAVRADRASVGVLAQLETFHPFVREEEQQIRQEAALYTASATARSSSEKREVAAAVAALEAKKRATSCVLCRPKTRCVICEVEQQLRAGKLKLAGLSSSQQPTELTGSQATLIKKTAAAIEPLKPQAELPRTLEALCTKFLALDTRSREEEEEEHRRLELELMSESALVHAKREEEAAARGQMVAGSKLLVGTVSMRSLAARLLTYARGSFNRRQEEQSSLSQ
ncbi:hypothetical protein BBJ28_00025421, partial [Nothophytophthora sp. Chile5]